MSKAEVAFIVFATLFALAALAVPVVALVRRTMLRRRDACWRSWCDAGNLPVTLLAPPNEQEPCERCGNRHCYFGIATRSHVYDPARPTRLKLGDAE